MDLPQASELPYRLGVGIFLINAAGKVLVARRIDEDADAWQMPQGGIDKGESPAAAALRELEEEIGSGNARIIGESSGWMNYDLPDHLIGKVWKGRYRGQKQKWFALRFLGSDDEIDPTRVAHPEFDDWKWVDVTELSQNVVAFKREIYEAIVKEFMPLLDAPA
ncbi:MAG: RNA pyrophosphohydrolase [Rhodospirillales bacterium]|jgi:putative (di)nucleoside polyphosphate hydrolase|nr:RNA pyrophosphohydrolase [Rhodospirillaceae bacterium]MDP6427856.1 RNA pyrophosphohydrolase [Rhodospirillales bacterium]MDP6642807.1 RNA pyrophosphohydrolase [Rhodospirillales bacterium]MDP6840746.1 RNA pyrophosphohydrolase [Rhodospirillales bacterium]|tara:strand:- start:636 stop:1127 length:492 start_codon:yes stop_codon:yes gene_type:complete